MQELAFAFRVSVIGISSVFLVMIILMLVLHLFGIFVRRWERRKTGLQGEKP